MEKIYIYNGMNTIRLQYLSFETHLLRSITTVPSGKYPGIYLEGGTME